MGYSEFQIKEIEDFKSYQVRTDTQICRVIISEILNKRLHGQGFIFVPFTRLSPECAISADMSPVRKC